jgi:hypothetical protein
MQNARRARERTHDRLRIPPGQRLAQRGTASTSIGIQRLEGSSGPITFSIPPFRRVFAGLVGLPGVTATFDPNPEVGSADATVQMTLSASRLAALGPRVVVVAGTPSGPPTAGPGPHTVRICVNVTPKHPTQALPGAVAAVVTSSGRNFTETRRPIYTPSAAASTPRGRS